MELITPNIASYLREIRIPLRLACTTASGWPMILSLWYIYNEGSLYCATQKQAKVVSYLQHNSQVAFEIAADEPPYCGVRGQGRATIDDNLGPDILRQLIERYLGSADSPLARKLLRRQESEVAIIIQPVNLYQWNFNRRMRDSVEQPRQKPCP